MKRLSRMIPLLVLAALSAIAPSAQARLTQLVIERVQPFAGGMRFGEVGAYEHVSGVARGELDTREQVLPQSGPSGGERVLWARQGGGQAGLEYPGGLHQGGVDVETQQPLHPVRTSEGQCEAPVVAPNINALLPVK